MQLFTYFLFFVVIWWVLFFIFLPIKNETSTEWQRVMLIVLQQKVIC